MKHEDLSSPTRYDTAKGWEPTPQPAKYKKLIADYKKANPEKFCVDSIFETRPANECTRTAEAKQQPFELFGSLWRTGELAVVVGESGVGMSVLAVQIAESITRGTGAQASLPANAAFRGRGGSLVTRQSSPVTAPAQPVLLLDLEHSDTQFAERYRCPSPIPGKLPVRYRFSSKLSRTTFGDLHIPDAFRRDVARYYRHSLQRMLAASEAKILIIDSLTLLDPRSTGPAAAIRTMQMLKRLTLKYGYSILVLAQSRQKIKIQKSAAGNLYSSLFTFHSSLSQPADSVFAIGRSTFAPDIRYIKHLKSTSAPVTHDASNVLVYQLDRMSEPGAGATGFRNSPPYEGGGSAASADRVVLSQSTNSQLSTLNSQLTPKPFLGFKYGGVAAEEDLIRDYERERREAEAEEERRLKKLQRSSREILVNGIISGDYQRYLRGE